MISILAPVVVTCLDMLLLKRSFTPVISSPPSLRIAFLSYAPVTSARSTSGRCLHLLLHCTLLLSSALLQNGAFIIRPITLAQPGGTSLRIAFLPSAPVTSPKSTSGRCLRLPLRCNLLLLSALLQNGALIIRPITLAQWGAWLYYHYRWLLHKMGRGNAYIILRRSHSGRIFV